MGMWWTSTGASPRGSLRSRNRRSRRGALLATPRQTMALATVEATGVVHRRVLSRQAHPDARTGLAQRIQRSDRVALSLELHSAGHDALRLGCVGSAPRSQR